MIINNFDRCKINEFTHDGILNLPFLEIPCSSYLPYVSSWFLNYYCVSTLTDLTRSSIDPIITREQINLRNELTFCTSLVHIIIPLIEYLILLNFLLALINLFDEGELFISRFTIKFQWDSTGSYISIIRFDRLLNFRACFLRCLF